MATKAIEIDNTEVDCGKQPICGCIGFCRGEAFGTGVRTGEQYVAGIRDDGRHVVHNGEIISDVTTHSAFEGAVKSVASLWRINTLSLIPNKSLNTFGSSVHHRKHLELYCPVLALRVQAVFSLISHRKKV